MQKPVTITEVQTRPGAILVEAVDPKRRAWTVGPVKTSPLMNFKTRTLEVPLDPSEDSIAVRAHEMAHPAYTPATLVQQGLKQGIPQLLTNAIEDGRVNTRLRAAGVAAPKCPPDRIRDLVAVSPMQAAAVSLACEGTGDEPIARQCVEERWGAAEAKWIAEQTRLITPKASPKVTLQIGRAILDHYGGDPAKGEGEGAGASADADADAAPDAGDKLPSMPESASSSGGAGSSGETGIPGPPPMSSGGAAMDTLAPPTIPRSDPADLVDLSAPPPGSEPVKPADKRLESLKDAVDGDSDLLIGRLSESDLIKRALEGYLWGCQGFYSRGGDKAKSWCPMTIKEPRLTIRLRHGKGRGHRPQYHGRAPRYPHRMASDRQIFASKQGSITYPGTVLIDVSGSMAIEPDDIERIVSAYPAALVATYCSDGKRGELVIVTKAGKRLDNLRGFNLGNGVDGPALRWLAKQARPRIWVCDGVVTGMGDDTARNLFDECLETVARSRIIPFPSLTTFLDELGSNA